MCSAGADAVSEGLETLTDSYDEGAANGGTVDPFAVEVLGLEAAVGRRLEEVGGEHAVFVGSDALAAFCFLLFAEAQFG